jgi:REP element-mobilizing transposase RayT
VVRLVPRSVSENNFETHDIILGGEQIMDEPIGFFLTWVTYGTWLPGDPRGWVEYRKGWKLPDPVRELEAAARMRENACRLSEQQRLAVEQQITETCRHRGWQLHAVNCRSNHVHVVVSAANVASKRVRATLKAWATRCLTAFDPLRENWWAEGGSVRWIFNDADLQSATTYTLDAQDGPK